MKPHVFELTRLPFPPSVNALYANVPGRGRVKTRDYKRYETLMAQWKTWNAGNVYGIADALRAGLGPGLCLHITRTFRADPSRVICLDNTPRRLDLTNLTKAFDDLLFKMLDTDDSWIRCEESFLGYTEKPGDEESVDVLLSIVPMKELPPAHACPEAVAAAAELRKHKNMLSRAKAAAKRSKP